MFDLAADEFVEALPGVAHDAGVKALLLMSLTSIFGGESESDSERQDQERPAGDPRQSMRECGAEIEGTGMRGGVGQNKIPPTAGILD